MTHGRGKSESATQGCLVERAGLKVRQFTMPGLGVLYFTSATDPAAWHGAARRLSWRAAECLNSLRCARSGP
jgi:hypothetical protein